MTDQATEDANKALVTEAFDKWRKGTGGPFDLLAPDAQWTIVGSSPLSATYRSKLEFYDTVVKPFNARLATPAVPTVHGIHADGDWVSIRYDADAMAIDGIPYHNTYSWYLRIKGGQVVEGFAFFDTRFYDALWERIKL